MKIVLEAFNLRLRGKPTDAPEPGPDRTIEYMCSLPITGLLNVNRKASCWWRCEFRFSGEAEMVEGELCEIWHLTRMSES